jgi:hypothetical protein
MSADKMAIQYYSTLLCMYNRFTYFRLVNVLICIGHPDAKQTMPGMNIPSPMSSVRLKTRGWGCRVYAAPVKRNS